MKKRYLIVILLIPIAILVCLTDPAAAQGEAFSETFDDPLMPGWEHSPEVIVTDGVLRIGPGNFAALMGAWENFNLTFRFSYSGSGETAISYRATDTGSYMLLINPEETVLMKTRPQAEPSVLARVGAAEIASDTWLEVSIRLDGGEHEVLVNGTPLLSASDNEPLPPGTVVFASHGERTTELDDLSLEIIQGEPEQAGGAQAIVPTAVSARPTSVPAATGTWQTLLEELFASQGSTLEPTTVLINLILAALSSFLLSRVYIYWGASLSNRRKFAANFMLVTVTTTFIILVVRSSVALSLGLVGALSIIRFRAAIKEPEELAYLFFAISLGIGLGDNQRLITLLAFLVVIALIGLARLLRQSQADVNLHLGISSHSPNKVEMPQVMEVLAKHCSKLRLLRYDENKELLEISFVVEFAHTSDLEQARTALLALAPALEISFLDNKGIW